MCCGSFRGFLPWFQNLTASAKIILSAAANEARRLLDQDIAILSSSSAETSGSSTANPGHRRPAPVTKAYATTTTTTTNTPSTTSSSSMTALTIEHPGARDLSLWNNAVSGEPVFPNSGSAHAVQAAYSLLAVTKNEHDSLQKAIAVSGTQFRRQVDVLHKAFLSLTAKCLEQATMDDPSGIQAAIQLAQRAGELGLPLHTPLYHKIMETAADLCPRNTDWMFRIGSIAGLNAPDVFVSALVVLIRKENFAIVANVLGQMTTYLNRDGVKQVFLAIRDVHDYSDSARRVSVLCRLVQQLEVSVQRIIVDESKERPVGDRETASVVTFDEPEGQDSSEHRLMAAIVELAEEHVAHLDEDEIGDLMQSEHDDTSSETVVTIEDVADQAEAVKHAAVSVLLCYVEDPRVRKFLAELAGCSYHKLSRGAMRVDKDTELEYFTDDYSAHSTSSLSKNRPPSWAFPDVTDQLTQLNGGTELEFSNEYEDILLDEETRLSAGDDDDDDEFDEEDTDFETDTDSDEP
jgi:hypothetical protein